jgi:hypothetical protein
MLRDRGLVAVREQGGVLRDGEHPLLGHAPQKPANPQTRADEPADRPTASALKQRPTPASSEEPTTKRSSPARERGTSTQAEQSAGSPGRPARRWRSSRRRRRGPRGSPSRRDRAAAAARRRGCRAPHVLEDEVGRFSAGPRTSAKTTPARTARCPPRPRRPHPREPRPSRLPSSAAGASDSSGPTSLANSSPTSRTASGQVRAVEQRVRKPQRRSGAPKGGYRSRRRVFAFGVFRQFRPAGRTAR